MGGLLHLFDFSNNSMARKLFTQKSHDDDLEAPRNSFELQVENSQSYCDMKDLPHCYGCEEEWYERSCYPIESSMKKLISEELSKRSNNKQSAPSVVAKLMGVDVLPLGIKSAVWPNDKKDENHETKLSEKERKRRGSSMDSNGFRRIGNQSVHCSSEEIEVVKCRSEKPKRREHPQEEELQKFKREFEAWQATRFKECSRIVDAQTLAQQTLNNQKLALYANPRGAELRNGNKHEENDLHGYHRYKPEKVFSRTRSFGRDFDQKLPLIEYDNKSDGGAPTRIVVLKPGPNKVYEYEDSLTTSSGTLEDRRGIEDFLEEVKERLRCELQGRALKRSATVRGSGIETPFSEKPSYDYRANHETESFSRDSGMNLPRSESARSYRSEVQFNAPNSPELISRDTRKFLTERLKNVLKRERSPAEVRPTVSDTERRLKQTGEILKDDPNGMRSRSFRCSNADEDGERVGNRDLSSRNLVRSLSAPVSGTSFGKLLLEDRHVLTGAQIQRKHEAVEHVSVDSIRRKEGFNFRKKVSSFRSTLRGRLFGKKIRSMIESKSFEHEYTKGFVLGPKVSNFYDRNENSTEVPPSPASVCSSTPEEFWRNVDYLSPISTPDVTTADDNGVPKVFREISSNLKELRKAINELESDEQENSPIEQEADDPETIDIENPAKAYVRDMLVASGLHSESSGKSSSTWGPFAKPINNKSVIKDGEEENQRKTAKENENDNNNPFKQEIDHKILFDLLNETLAIVLGPPPNKSSFRRKIIGSSALAPLQGRKLLESVWQIMCEYLYPPTEDWSCFSLDNIIAWDLGRTPWSSLMDEEISSLGKDVECLITDDLVAEIVNDLQLNVSV